MNTVTNANAPNINDDHRSYKFIIFIILLSTFLIIYNFIFPTSYFDNEYNRCMIGDLDYNNQCVEEKKRSNLHFRILVDSKIIPRILKN